MGPALETLFSFRCACPTTGGSHTSAVGALLYMEHVSYTFNNASTDYYFAGGFALLKKLVDPASTVVITDENVFHHHKKRFKGWNAIVLAAGEEHKIQSTADAVIENLVSIGADRKTTLVGVGGGVITDLTGYIASIYMRGIRFGFVPTTLLAMVDASIGGKNGVDVGVYKNLVGNIRQPGFLLYDLIFLSTLPEAEWENGFAEIIKHACIRDLAMFKELEAESLRKYRKTRVPVCELITRNARLKSKIVKADEFETGERRLLNFGHTLGHALENQYELSHGQAISIGMAAAARLSAQLTGFSETDRVLSLLDKYGLPVNADYDRDAAFDVLVKDKKNERGTMNYVLLQKIGKAIVQPIEINKLKKLLSAV